MILILHIFSILNPNAEIPIKKKKIIFILEAAMVFHLIIVLSLS